MENETVHIEHFHLRVPGLDTHQASYVGQRALSLAAERLPHTIHTQQLAQLNLKLSIPENASPDVMAERLANRIVEALS